MNKGTSMTYRLNPGLAKIKSSLVLIFPDGSRKEYSSGTEAAEEDFDKKYLIEEVRAVEGTVELVLTEQDVPAMNWTGEENISFF